MGIATAIRSLLAAALVAGLALAVPAPAQTFRPLIGRVVDAAHVLGPGVRGDLAPERLAFATEPSHQLVVAMAPSRDGRSVASSWWRRLKWLAWHPGYIIPLIFLLWALFRKCSDLVQASCRRVASRADTSSGPPDSVSGAGGSSGGRGASGSW